MALRDYFEKLGGLWQDVFEKIDSFFEEVQQGEHRKALAVGAIILILAILAIFLFVQSRSLDLIITDANGNPIAGALVQLYDGVTGELIGEAVTNENGVAHFDGVDPNRPYTYTVSKDGYGDSTGSYDPRNPDSGTIVLKKRPIGFENPPVLPPTPTPQRGGPIVITPTPTPNPWNQPEPEDGGNPNPNPTDYVADSKLTVHAKDKETSQPVANALLTLKDEATTAFLAQGRTNGQGTLSANVKRGSAISILAQADGYNPTTAVVPINNAENEATIALLSNTSAQSGNGNVSVVDEQGQPIQGARVQIFASPSILDQLTGLIGFIQVSLEKLQVYIVLASKPGYFDGSANLSAGGNVTIVLRVNPNYGASSLTVNTLNADGSPAVNAHVTIYRQVADQYVDVQSQATSTLGAAVFSGLSPESVRVNATAPAGEP
ncbi:MAG: carboxypeptidase-like regulatory domain-containing protein, partial [Candidatus Micrarchaeota archaeon]|nr:carboxypeptidase-like regulatory domain-containing protein [Candidatus Micrarchaeota archaeon]